MILQPLIIVPKNSAIHPLNNWGQMSYGNAQSQADLDLIAYFSVIIFFSKWKNFKWRQLHEFHNCETCIYGKAIVC